MVATLLVPSPSRDIEERLEVGIKVSDRVPRTTCSNLFCRDTSDSQSCLAVGKLLAGGQRFRITIRRENFTVGKFIRKPWKDTCVLLPYIRVGIGSRVNDFGRVGFGHSLRGQ